jgi:lipoprotein-anchoring transpeptidase ErfK/SrfK
VTCERTGWWFSPGPPVSSTKIKLDRQNITEILLKVAINTTVITVTLVSSFNVTENIG